MSVRLSEEEAREPSVDRGDERNACVDESLRLRERAETRDEGIQSARARVGRVEGPVARALVVPVVDATRREVDLRVGVWRGGARLGRTREAGELDARRSRVPVIE